MLDGVVPMLYKKDKFNLPIAIWLPLRFPVAPPVAYVKRNPKQFMFNDKCRVVDASQDGLIVSEYLRNWSYPLSNLQDFLGDLRIYFAECPPLYQILPGGAPPPAHQHQPSSSGGSSSSGVGMMSNGSGGGSGNVVFNPLSPNTAAARPPSQQQPPPQRPQPPPPQQQQQPQPMPSFWGGISGQRPPQPPQQQQPQQFTAAPAAGQSIWAGAMNQQQQQQQHAAAVQRQEALKNQRETAYHLALTTALSARLSGALEAAAAADVERQTVIQSELQRRGVTVADHVQKLHQEREQLDSAAHELIAAGAALEKWLLENEPRAQSLRAAVAGEIDPDQAIVPGDPLSRQALATQSADLALEDTMSALDRAFEGKRLVLGDYLQQVRAVSRRQFTARSLSSKIASRQESEKVAAEMKKMSIFGAAPPSSTATTGTTTAGTANNNNIGGGVPLVTAVSGNVAPAQLPIGDLWHTSGGILLNPLAAAANKQR